MSNEEHVRRLLDEGVEAWNAWREAEPKVRPDLRAANLRGANLRDADLIGADLRDADLRDADLSGAGLIGADLSGADLRGADLRGAEFRGADLRDADLSGAGLRDADLRDADLISADLRDADLSGADLTYAHIDRHTNFEDVRVSGETIGLGPWIFNPDQYIIREIEFPPEYRQAGIGIMNYFAEVIRDKYPDIPATVQITQEELTVRMTIETDTGHREIVERTLEEYGLVVAGQRQPAEILSDPVAIMGLKHKLEMAEMEVRHANNQLQLACQQNQEKQAQINRLEARMDKFQLLMGNHLRHADRLVDVLEVQAFAPLRSLLDRGLTEADKAEVQRILTEAGQQSPGLLQRLAEQITSGAIGGMSAALLTPWLQEVAHQGYFCIKPRKGIFQKSTADGACELISVND
jgi:hypothetical protein